MRLMLLKSTLVGATLAAFLILGAGQALANHVSCGDTITHDTTLDSDLVDCPTFGLEVAADGVTLDLNGHLIDGQGPDPFFSGFDGVINRAGHDGVTIRNGAIREFDTGVRLTGGSQPGGGFFGANRNTVQRLAISAVERGVLGFEADGNVIERNAIRSDVLAITLLGVFSNTGSDQNRIVKNDTDSVRPAQVTSGGGIYARGDGNVIEHNAVRRGSIVASGNENSIAKNSVSFGLDSGLFADGAGNTIEKNESFGNSTGIFVSAHASVRVEHNVVFENRNDGITVSGAPLLAHNRAVRNGDDGIEITTPGARLAHNRADRNRDYGIEAVPGVIDEGGNKASGNGNPAQCLNVECK